MNLRPLVLGLSLLAGATPVALAQQTAPQETSANDLGFSPGQMADFAGQPNESSVVYAGGPEQPQFVPGPQPYGSTVGIPAEMNGPQPAMTGYQLQLTGALAPVPNGPPANPQQKL